MQVGIILALSMISKVTQGGFMGKLMTALFLLSIGTVWATELPITSASDSVETVETVKYWILDTDN